MAALRLQLAEKYGEAAHRAEASGRYREAATLFKKALILLLSPSPELADSEARSQADTRPDRVA